MINFLLRIAVKCLLWLRYRIRVKGMDAVAARGTRGILFLPNHPALIDPIVVVTTLHKHFAPRPLADQDQVDRPGVRWAARRVGARPIPSVVTHGAQAREAVEQVLADCIEGLRHGENLVLYPSGHAYHQRLEDLRGNSAVHAILQALPEVRVVLVRQRGLWGSAFSRASGCEPQLGSVVKKAVKALLLSGLFFAPRRQVSLELVEPADLPRAGSRDEINEHLEAFYNRDAPYNTYVPYTLWERGGTQRRPEPKRPEMSGSVDNVPAATREIVLSELRDLTGRNAIRDDQRLAHDLGLDSLARTELLVWLEQEFGFPQGDADALRTVGDALLAACGEAVSSGPGELKPIPTTWFAHDPSNRPLELPQADTVTAAFLEQARRSPGRVVVADPSRGARTFRDLVTSILALKPHIEKLDGDRVGIMLPASVAADVLYLATLFAGKTPVMVNWTVGPRHMSHSLDLVDVRHVLTAKLLVTRLEAQGKGFGSAADRFVYLEHLGERISLPQKLAAWLRSRLSWASLRRAAVPDTAVILFTSGSEALPKAVPLTHANLLANLRDVLRIADFTENDRLLGFLPPFHSFGITVGVLTAACMGLRTVYHPNPTQGATLARLAEAYRTTVIIGTPTFLNGIVRSSTNEQLATVRLFVTGAEKCSDRVYAALAERCPQAVALEGYGVTECSPVVSVNDLAAPMPGTIGRVLPSMDHAIVHPDTGQRVPDGAAGLLLVRGPNVFAGYLNYDGRSPFVELEGKPWYSTGDLVSEDANGVLTFRGRLKRFVKLGGEMISLPAIEDVLASIYEDEASDTRTLAIVATHDEDRPEIILCTTLPLDRQEVNRTLRDAGLSPLHNIRRVLHVDEIPLLGSGKTDHRSLRAQLADEEE
ncbi:MAG: AMP-binding protein [Candidatus Brocadiae bacterium]|nr:AMP-binding protein [Candidatus Brocadiia bacterium]